MVGLLANDDSKIVSLKTRTDIEVLKLSEQTSLELDTINTILSSNKNSLKRLALDGLTQITHFDYESTSSNNSLNSLPAIAELSKLAEIDIRGTNTLTSMKQIMDKTPRLLIYLDNENIAISELEFYLSSPVTYGAYLHKSYRWFS